jgi:hypothetical protein
MPDSTVHNADGDTEICDVARRKVLQHAASAVVLGAVATPFLRGYASSQKPADRALTIVYPGGPQVRFDANYYRDYHLRLFMDIYGPAIERFELRTVDFAPVDSTPGALGGQTMTPPEFTAVINAWIVDFAIFKARSTEAAYRKMGDDKKNFTNTSSTVQVDEVLSALGDPRAAARVGDRCLSILYPNGADARWDIEKYCEACAPRMMQVLGSDAIRRIEVRKGMTQLEGGSPAYLGGINIYVKDQHAFSVARSKHGDALDADAARLTNVRPVRLSTIVYGVDTTHREIVGTTI